MWPARLYNLGAKGTSAIEQHHIQSRSRKLTRPPWPPSRAAVASYPVVARTTHQVPARANRHCAPKLVPHAELTEDRFDAGMKRLTRG